MYANLSHSSQLYSGENPCASPTMHSELEVTLAQTMLLKEELVDAAMIPSLVYQGDQTRWGKYALGMDS